MDLFFYSILFVLGAIVGSFINCLVWRIKNRKNFVWERSQCPNCRRKLTWYENIPLASFLILKGKCKTCQGKIPTYYFWAELFTGLLFVLVFWLNGPVLVLSKLIFELHLVCILIFIFIYDTLYKEILPGVVWLGIGVVLFYYLFFQKPDYLSVFYGALFGFGFFALQYFASKGRWIGGGDVRLGVLMGVILGLSKLVVALLLAYWIGALVGVGLIILKKSKFNSEIPLGTFLVVGTLFAYYFGENIISWYINFIN